MEYPFGASLGDVGSKDDERKLFGRFIAELIQGNIGKLCRHQASINNISVAFLSGKRCDRAAGAAMAVTDRRARHAWK